MIGFFHIATIGNYKSVIEEIFNSICESGILLEINQLNICIVGNGDVNIKNNEKIIIHRLGDIGLYEFPTLQILENTAQISDDNLFYIHTKGVGTENNECIDDWRKYMIYFIIKKYKKCNEELDKGFDVVGVDWRNEPVGHFSGNFWWTKSSYIKSLPKIKDISQENYPRVLTLRHNAEFWIGMNKEAKIKSLWDCGINQYQRHLHRYESFNYINKDF